MKFFLKRLRAALLSFHLVLAYHGVSPAGNAFLAPPVIDDHLEQTFVPGTATTGSQSRARILDGRKMAREMLDQIKRDVASLSTRGIQPGLAMVQAGNHDHTKQYITNARRACEKAGIAFYEVSLPDDVSEDVLLERIHRLNRDPRVHGILIHFPLPEKIDKHRIIQAIDPAKDVDCSHPQNLGSLLLQGPGDRLEEKSMFYPCTPHAIIKLVQNTGVPISGKKVVIVGRSITVGKPLALMFLNLNAVVTVCHSKTEDLAAECAQADILIGALGRPRYITASMVKKGAMVIDVGIHHTADGLCGDVDFDAVVKKAAWITPVPGGVGPMTVSILLLHTVQAARKQLPFIPPVHRDSALRTAH